MQTLSIFESAPITLTICSGEPLWHRRHNRLAYSELSLLLSLDDWLDEIDERDTSSMEKLCIDPMRDPHACRAEKMASKLTKS